MTILALILCSLIGVTLGLLGGGGSILAVPVLVYVAGIAAPDAVGMSLAVVGVTSLFAGILHARAGNLDLRLAATFGIFGVGNAFLGARLSRGLRPGLLLALFAAVMIGAGLSMVYRSARRERAAPPARPRLLSLAAAGLGVGLLTGFLGVGGGFLVVPALVLFGRIPMHLAVGTSLIVIAINCAAGFLGSLGGGTLDLTLTGGFGAAALAGAIAGQRAAGRVSAESLRKFFGLFVIVLGVALLVKNLL